MLLAHRGRGEERYYSLVARDMTERELREAQQRRHQDELAHTARLVTLGELASGIAHEINQPLAAVMNYASASQRYLAVLGSQPEAAGRVAEGLARIGEHAGHAAEVIKRLRAFLRKGQRRLQALDLNQVAREAIGLCAWEAGHWQVAVEEAMTDNPPPLYADRVLLEQVFLNLLRNAIEANREAHPGSPSRVVIGSRVEPGGLLCLWVRDQGPGVPADQLEHIFTPFHTSKPEGLGLGLSMSRSIVEGFGGTLEAELPADGGLLMNCRLPPPPAPRRLTMAMPDEALVYVVDDDQGMLESTVWLLESVGLKARPFTQGRDFLEACEGGRHACVLLDVRMPGMGGLNVQDELLARGIDLPVIFVSGHADVPIVVRAFKAGAVDFIEKPYNEQLLLDSVQRALDRHARRRRHRDLDAGLRERLDSLTPRERDVLLPLVRGYTSREVAEQLEVSVKTVDLYRARVMKRMQAQTLPELVGMAIAAGLVDPLRLREDA